MALCKVILRKLFYLAKVECRQIRKGHYGYSDGDKSLYVVHNHERIPVGPLDLNVHISPGFSVPDAKQMVSRSTRNLQRGHLLLPRIVQNCFSFPQCRSIRGSADRKIR